ncbi:MAG: LuxR C-terminal-related transcriptional regulator [Burkholderiaceae bacterium]|nr:LuxR C-terminal-related transcriptional regulator [Burkholderiaceae bacterium]
MGFPIISGVLMRGQLTAKGIDGRSFGNTHQGHAEAYKDASNAMRDPVLDRLMAQPLPVVYDQSTYVAAGAGELWEAQAPYGYRTGIAVKLHLPGEKMFLLGVDREDALPAPSEGLMHLIASLQLLASHAMVAADRLLSLSRNERDFPRLTKRELDVLSWTAQGKTAWEVGVILSMSEKTVNFHLGNAMRKLEVTSKHQAVLKCVTAGLL